MRAHRYARYFTLFAALFLAGCGESDDVYLCEDIACGDANRVCVDGGENDATCGGCVAGFYAAGAHFRSTAAETQQHPAQQNADYDAF